VKTFSQSRFSGSAIEAPIPGIFGANHRDSPKRPGKAVYEVDVPEGVRLGLVKGGGIRSRPGEVVSPQVEI